MERYAAVPVEREKPDRHTIAADRLYTDKKEADDEAELLTSHSGVAYEAVEVYWIDVLLKEPMTADINR